jgi:hypothetical protein
MTKAPALVIGDIAATTFDWGRLVRQVRGPHKKNEHVPVLGFGPHVDLALREQALENGCTAVVGRSAIVQNLPSLIEKHTWQVNQADCDEATPPLVLKAVEQFNAGLYFEAHETLEDAWNAETSRRRTLYQGILQIGVGYLHIRRDNWRGAMKVLERGIAKTAHFRPVCMGLDVAHIVSQAQAIHAEIAALGPERLAEFDQNRFPKIKLVTK